MLGRQQLRPSSEAARILIVDDEVGSRVLLEKLLRSQGYDAIAVGSGAEAMPRIEAGDIDLIVLDLMMHQMDGIEVCEFVRKRLQLWNLPILFTSALADRESRVRAKEAGGDDFLIKPVDGLELLVRTKNLLKIRAQQRHLECQSRELARELREINDELARARRTHATGQVTVALGDEVGRLAGVWRASLEDLLARGGARPKNQEIARLMQAASQLERCARRIGRLAGPMPEDQESCDLCGACERAVGALNQAGWLNGVSVCTEFPAQRPAVAMRRAQMDRMLLNLLMSCAEDLLAAAGGELAMRVALQDELGRVRLFVNTRPGLRGGARVARYRAAWERESDLSFLRQACETVGGRIILIDGAGEGSTVALDLPALSPRPGASHECNVP